MSHQLRRENKHVIGGELGFPVGRFNRRYAGVQLKQVSARPVVLINPSLFCDA
jgi:hypothetical protein